MAFASEKGIMSKGIRRCPIYIFCDRKSTKQPLFPEPCSRRVRGEERGGRMSARTANRRGTQIDMSAQTGNRRGTQINTDA
jgi:hypothetical protein